MKKKILKIGNAQAFWGDNLLAAATLLDGQPDLDYLTLDFLAEVSLSIMAAQRAKDSSLGYAADFIDVVKSLVPQFEKGSKVKIVTNAGGLNPKGCAEACKKALNEAGISRRIAVVTGDDVLDLIGSSKDHPLFNHLETGESIATVFPNLATANAYLGAEPIISALQEGAEIVITGRVADPSLVVAPCVFHFGWSLTDYDLLANATIAGHLIECGTQVTGGISTHWLDLPDLACIGFPVIEMSEEGSFVVTKPKGSGGKVSIESVKEQLLYEIADPDSYLSPDVVASFLSLTLEEEGPNRILVKGGKGRAPPPTLKVSATYEDGFKAEGMLAIVGQDVHQKARRCGEIILEKMGIEGLAPERHCIELLGCGDVVPGVFLGIHSSKLFECVLRVAVADHRKEVLRCFARQIAPMVTSGPPGTTGYLSGRPHIRPIFGYWPCLINSSDVHQSVALLD